MSTLFKIALAFTGIVGATLVVLFATSWASLEFTEYGLCYNWITKGVSPR
jgi:hypothetical protein